MPIHVSCSHCDAGFNLADGLLGKRVRCRIIFTEVSFDFDDARSKKLLRFFAHQHLAE